MKPFVPRLALPLAALLCAAPASADGRHRAVSVSYFGDMIFHPGVRLGGELGLAEAGGHRLFLGANLGAYHHRGYQTALLADVELGYRYTFTGGFFLEGRAGAGYLHGFLAGTTWEPDGNGGFDPVAAAGNGAFMPTASAGLGFDWSRRGAAPVAVFLRTVAFGQLPVNDRLVPHVAAQLGLSWHFDR